MIVTGTPAHVTVQLDTADEIRQFEEILNRANGWLTANYALPWPVLRPLKEAVDKARR